MAKHGKEQKGKGYEFAGGKGHKGMPNVKGYSDCCPPVTKPKNMKIDSISGILKGGGYRKLTKRVSNSLKQNVLKPTKSLTKKVLGKVRKLTKKMKRKNSKKQRGGAACPNRPKSDHRDPSKRKFGCRQDKWTPDCI